MKKIVKDVTLGHEPKFLLNLILTCIEPSLRSP